ncbi:UNVERIFIED_CONTAM: hypothetical protein HDU68_011230 [Siphonaria sp. JEL0065]|nr:hypothetical protein HDU68_011230 [Siphonaria sp. JEL0065]
MIARLHPPSAKETSSSQALPTMTPEVTRPEASTVSNAVEAVENSAPESKRKRESVYGGKVGNGSKWMDPPELTTAREHPEQFRAFLRKQSSEGRKPLFLARTSETDWDAQIGRLGSSTKTKLDSAFILRDHEGNICGGYGVEDKTLTSWSAFHNRIMSFFKPVHAQGMGGFLLNLLV